MQIVKYTPKLKIVNTEQLPRGTGAKFLLALVQGDVFIAHSWKRSLPKSIEPGYAIIQFGR